MALFQNSVLQKHLKLQDVQAIEKAYRKFSVYFHNAERQRNIRDSQEEQFQEGFLRELFVNILDYTLNPEPDFNLTTELKNKKGAKKVDGAILKEEKAIAVIELKSTKNKDLESIRQQAIDYKAIKKAGGTPLTKTQEMNLMEVFETKKAEAQTLKAEIGKTDSEIDRMVHELYNLTDEEIAIVENS